MAAAFGHPGPLRGGRCELCVLIDALDAASPIDIAMRRVMLIFAFFLFFGSGILAFKWIQKGSGSVGTK